MPGAEYLIRPSSHDGWLVIHANSLAEVLIPRGYSVEPGAGFGDLHLQVQGLRSPSLTKILAGMWDSTGTSRA